MASVALFYNPVAGGGRFKNRLDEVLMYMQESGLQVIPWRITSNAEMLLQITRVASHNLHAVVGVGGDGTIHGLANALMACGLKVPMAIFPEGTSNDVANHLGIPLELENYCRVLTKGRLASIDLGQVNNRYFINVAAAGLLTDTAHEVQHRWKNLLGRGAYLLKSLEKLPRIQNLRVNLLVDDKTVQIEAMLFLVLNGGTAGGFQGLMPEGDMNDGLLDFLAIKPVSLPQATQLLYNFLRGQLLQNENIFYCQGRQFRIEIDTETSTDLDGEVGPPMPWDIRVCPSALQIWLPQTRPG